MADSKIVPREPTAEMIDAGPDDLTSDEKRRAWQAMYDAAAIHSRRQVGARMTDVEARARKLLTIAEAHIGCTPSLATKPTEIAAICTALIARSEALRAILASGIEYDGDRYMTVQISHADWQAARTALGDAT